MRHSIKSWFLEALGLIADSVQDAISQHLRARVTTVEKGVANRVECAKHFLLDSVSYWERARLSVF